MFWDLCDLGYGIAGFLGILGDLVLMVLVFGVVLGLGLRLF